MKDKRYRCLASMVSDPDRKSVLNIIKESFHCAIIEKEVPYYYFTNLLYKRGRDGYRNYIGFNDMYRVINNMFHKEGGGSDSSLDDKLMFSKILDKEGVATANVLANSDGYTLNAKNGSFTIESSRELSSFLVSLMVESRSRSIFVKPVDGAGGKNAFKVDEGTLQKVVGDLKIFDAMRDTRYLFQEGLVQHDFSNNFYSGCINTIRVHTYLDETMDDVVISSALMRFGRHGSVVDNGSSGGLFVPVDVEKWELSGCGMTYLNQGGDVFESHPDTKLKFDRQKIPFGKDIEQLVKKSARLFECKFIGWDIALTPDGPVVIEGNSCPHLVMAQIACGGFKSHPIYKNIFSEYIGQA